MLSKYAQEKQTLRNSLRHKRRALSAAKQNLAAYQLSWHLCRHHKIKHAQHIALYLPDDGEISPGSAIKRLLKLGKTCYLPVVKGNKMVFCQYQLGDKLKLGRFGIAEPLPKAARISANALDIVCLPLVGFDSKGQRLGRGGGYYDRCFAFGYQHTSPYLMGLAHACQQVANIPNDQWDIPLAEIVTDKGCLKCTEGQ